MVEVSKKEIPGSKRSTHGSILLQALKGEPLSSVFSSDGTFISVSAAPHCGESTVKKSQLVCTFQDNEGPGSND